MVFFFSEVEISKKPHQPIISFLSGQGSVKTQSLPTVCLGIRRKGMPVFYMGEQDLGARCLTNVHQRNSHKVEDFLNVDCQDPGAWKWRDVCFCSSLFKLKAPGARELSAGIHLFLQQIECCWINTFKGKAVQSKKPFSRSWSTSAVYFRIGFS